MPGRDGTGPLGGGPMTGRGSGFCTGDTAPRLGRIGAGPGFWGCGRGWRHWFRATALPHWMRFGSPPGLRPERENQALRNRARALQEELDAIQSRLSETEGKP